MHIEIKNHHLTPLLLGLTESRLNAVLAFNTFTVSLLTIDCVFRILVANRQQVLIDNDEHVVKATK